MKKDRIDVANLDKSHQILKRAGRHIIIEFDKCFKNAGKDLNLFKIDRDTYSRNADHICKYANYFIKYYDTDKEYLTAAMNIKYQIDSKSMTYTLHMFMSDLIEYILSDSMVDKIWKLVDDQYMIDLVNEKDKEKEMDLHALQFMNEHGKALMAISMACKLTIPLVAHYHTVRGQELANIAAKKHERVLTSKEFFYKIFCSYFPLFQGESDLLNKLMVTANMHICKTLHSEAPLWMRAENKNITPNIQLTKLMILIVIDLMPKYEFERNLVKLNFVSIPDNITNALIAKDKWEYYDVSINTKDEELSGLEKLK